MSYSYCTPLSVLTKTKKQMCKKNRMKYKLTNHTDIKWRPVIFCVVWQTTHLPLIHPAVQHPLTSIKPTQIFIWKTHTFTACVHRHTVAQYSVRADSQPVQGRHVSTEAGVRKLLQRGVHHGSGQRGNNMWLQKYKWRGDVSTLKQPACAKRQTAEERSMLKLGLCALWSNDCNREHPANLQSGHFITHAAGTPVFVSIKAPVLIHKKNKAKRINSLVF